MKGIDWENRKGGGTKKCRLQPVRFPFLLAPSPIWFAPLELIVSPIQNPSEPGINPFLAAKSRKIIDPWPDLKVFRYQNSWYTNGKAQIILDGHWLLGNRTLANKWLAVESPKWCGNYCVSVWSQNGQESCSYLPWVRSCPMCNTFTCHYLHNTFLTRGLTRHCTLQNLQFCPQVCFQTK